MIQRDKEFDKIETDTKREREREFHNKKVIIPNCKCVNVETGMMKRRVFFQIKNEKDIFYT